MTTERDSAMWCEDEECDERAQVRVTDHRKVSMSLCRDCHEMLWDSDMVRWNGGKPTIQDLDKAHDRN